VDNELTMKKGRRHFEYGKKTNLNLKLFQHAKSDKKRYRLWREQLRRWVSMLPLALSSICQACPATFRMKIKIKMKMKTRKNENKSNKYPRPVSETTVASAMRRPPLEVL